MESKKSGNSRFLVSSLKVTQDNLNQIMGEIDHIVHNTPNIELVNYDIYLLISKDDIKVGRFIVGAPLKVGNDFFSLDEEACEIIETSLEGNFKTLLDLTQSAREILVKNSLENLRLTVENGDFEKLSVIYGQNGSLKWY